MSETDKRKQLRNEYKERNIVGGIYKVTNSHNGMYLVDYALDIQAKENAFSFMISTGSCFDYRLKEDQKTFGNKVFTFEVLETLEKKKEQTRAQFLDDLETMSQLWDEKLDISKKY
jgi:hypothetical protein